MSLIILGINHQTAPLEVRERFALSQEQVLSCLPKFLLPEVVLLSTCNRTEVIAPIEHSEALIQKLSELFHLDTPTLQAHWYVHHENAAMAHLARVTAGLDSMILGEPQIFGQVKEAYELAQRAGMVGKILDPIFQYVFSLSKKVRSETAIGKSSVSVAFTAVNLAKHIFANLSKCYVLILGAGETAALAARHFSEQGVQRFYFANRTLENAFHLAHTYGGEVFSLEEFYSVLPKADIILTATESQAPLIASANLTFVKSRQKPLLLLDLSVPRNIDAEVAPLPDCYLYTIDDLQAMVQQGLEQRRDAALIANEMIQYEVEQFFKKQKIALYGKEMSEFSNVVDTLIENFLREAKNSGNVQEAIALGKKLAKRVQHEAITFIKKT